MLNTVNIHSSYGHKTKTVSLNDGTKVHLNAGTTLSYSKNFNSTSREVTLMEKLILKLKKALALLLFQPTLQSDSTWNKIQCAFKRRWI